MTDGWIWDGVMEPDAEYEVYQWDGKTFDSEGAYTFNQVIGTPTFPVVPPVKLKPPVHILPIPPGLRTKKKRPVSGNAG